MDRDTLASLFLIGFSAGLLYVFLDIVVNGAHWAVEPNKIILSLEIAMVIGGIGLGVERIIKHRR